MEPDIEARGLRISCAMPAAISPTAASRSRRPASRSRRFTSVTSWKVKRWPTRPSGNGNGAAVSPRSIARPSGRSYEKSARRPRGSSSRTTWTPNVAGKASISRASRPIADAESTPVMTAAALLKLTTRQSASVVTRPLTRLSMTCALNWRRSSIATDASTSCASLVRSRSASDPASRATAKNPPTLVASTYWANLTAGRLGVSGDPRREVLHADILAGYDRGVPARAQGRQLQRAATRANQAGRDDGQQVQRREVAADAAGDQDESGHQDGVQPDLHVDHPRMALDVPQHDQVDHAEAVGQADQEEERIDRKDPGRGELEERRRAQQGGRNDQPSGDEPRHTGPDGGRLGRCPRARRRCHAAIGPSGC